MKLYATVESEREGREAKKGANECLQVKLTHGNNRMATIFFYAGDGEIQIEGVNGVVKRFTPFDLGHK